MACHVRQQGMQDWFLRIGAILNMLDPTASPRQVVDSIWAEVATWEAIGGVWLHCLRGHLQPHGIFHAGASPDNPDELAELSSPNINTINTDGLPVTVRQICDGNVPVAVVLISHHSNHREAGVFLTDALSRWCLDRLRLQLEGSELIAENETLRQSLMPRIGQHDIVTVSGTMETLIRAAARAAQSNASVMIQGETGTGKELLANLIHSHSSRSNQSMISINAGALTPSLLESELFGHRRGAFTGADYDRKGLFEVADGGTVFLDEIGELSLDAQVRLLRVLQEGVITRVGEHTTRSVNVRIIAATHRELEEEVAAGRFRQDLFYRLNVVSLNVPPLRERPEDIPILVNHFLQRFNRENFKTVNTIPRDVLETLLIYPWPGNVRELENCIQKAVVMATSNSFSYDLIPPAIRSYAVDNDERPSAEPMPTEVDEEFLVRMLQRYAEAEGCNLGSFMRQAEQILITWAIDAERGVKLRAARKLGINRVTLDRKLVEYGLQVQRGKGVIPDFAEAERS